MNDDYHDLLRAKGIVLDDMGLADVALARVDTLNAIQILRSRCLPILGGDVFFLSGGKVAVAYANWYVDRQPNEKTRDFASRSCEKAEHYVSSFPTSQDYEPLFVLVIAANP